MPNLQSAAKRERQNERRRTRNKTARSRVRTRLRRFHEAVESGDVQGAEEAQRLATKELDKAARKRVVHPNWAANRKSRMARDLQRLQRS